MVPGAPRPGHRLPRVFKHRLKPQGRMQIQLGRAYNRACLTVRQM